jgi:hypothetical protein
MTEIKEIKPLEPRQSKEVIVKDIPNCFFGDLTPKQ